ncbi:YezD family protein [Arenimonas terrae]|jgi:hypothetical protein|uniref:DUF2292 domain-containing protein n=1 Tax=Arenimonas terrae TaxID=2546226 RepID=A0A5C4RR04_9GAMM|nr:YezD family protein [Arenimonas terrae]TNJ33656.1 DUF2292 domain-containing protein [Arenimonas terrae]
MDPRKPVTAAPSISPQELAVLETLRATPYGSVEVVLHQSRIVQVVKTEKVKLDSDTAPVAPP